MNSGVGRGLNRTVVFNRPGLGEKKEKKDEKESKTVEAAA